MLINGLTPKQMDFIEEWYKNGKNGTRAYLKTFPGSAYNTASTEAAKLLARPEVKEFIEKNIDLQIERIILSEIEIKEQLSKIGQGAETDVTTCYDKDGNIEFKKESTKLSDRLRALELLGKTTGMYIDNNNISSDMQPVVFVNNIPKEADDSGD